VKRETIVIDLAIDAAELLRLYRGFVRTVIARSRDGRWVQFPAHVLRAHVAPHGVQGAFALRVEDGRLTTMERLD